MNMRYTKEQLKEMAKEYFTYKYNDDSRCTALIGVLAVLFKSTPEQVEEQIKGFLDG